MMNIEILWELQSLEDKIIEIQRDAGILDMKAKISEYKAKYNEICRMTKQFAQTYKENEKDSAKGRLDLREISYKIKEAEENLYNGSIKKIKALNQLQNDIEQMKKKEVEITKEIDDNKNQSLIIIKQIKRNKGKCEIIKEKISEFKVDLEQIIDETEKNSIEINNKIKEVQGLLTDQDLKFYYDKKEKITPVIVCYKEDICDGCKMQFSIIFAQDIKKNYDKRDYVCENCGRIIYIPKPQEA